MISRGFTPAVEATWAAVRARGCSLAARGLLAELLPLFIAADGYLLVAGATPSDAALAHRAQVGSLAELRRVREELLAQRVLAVTADGVLYAPAVVRAATCCVAARPRLQLAERRGA